MVNSKVRKLRCGVFIDGSNVVWGSLNMESDVRWFVDYEKIKDYLKLHYKPQFYRFFGAIDTEPKSPVFVEKAKMQARIYAKLEGMGYDVILKPLKYIKQDDGTYKTKGDMDVELSMSAMDSINDLDTFVLFGGDCDYHPLIQRLHSQGKHIRIYSFDALLSWELRTFAIKNTRCSYKTIDSLKDKFEYIKITENVLTNNKTRSNIKK
jgi:uncharacterized LabA/DUF88 family protein